MHVEQMDILSKGSAEVFVDQYLNKKPCVIQREISDWPAIHSWTPEYLKQNYGAAVITLAWFDPRDTATFLDQTLADVHKTMSFRDYLETLENLDSSYALREDTSLFEHCPGLLSELGYFSPFCSKAHVADLKYIALWSGPANYVTGLHSDPGETLLFQITGSKEVTLFGPDESKFLYEEDQVFQKFEQGALELRRNRDYLEVLRDAVRWSKVNPFDSDIGKFPLLINARSIRGFIRQGDALYIPDGWWHSLRSLDVTISVSIEPNWCGEFLLGYQNCYQQNA